MPTVLLVEDNTSSQFLLEDVFSYDHIPARLITVTSGEQVQIMAVSLKPDLILMDLRLPGIDGLETTEILRRNPATKDIPVWAITAYAMPGDEEKAMASGCNEYITKPFPTRMLADRLRAFFRELSKTEPPKNVPSQSADR
ncbi:MAG: response regulator [Pirellulales bacterium]|nr:response regulator [Pirellulales bacterium]